MKVLIDWCCYSWGKKTTKRNPSLNRSHFSRSDNLDPSKDQRSDACRREDFVSVRDHDCCSSRTAAKADEVPRAFIEGGGYGATDVLLNTGLHRDYGD